MRVLVVEDERDLNNIITKYLKKNNFNVDNVFDGEEALDYLNSAEYDLVILDVMMPKINGYEVLKTMRKENIQFISNSYLYINIKILEYIKRWYNENFSSWRWKRLK